ncbi:MAG: hypothetical protein PHE87_07025 [Victivallaceae bacterium]|nr:hypothetical protein [Victivallaceae bacterium]
MKKIAMFVMAAVALSAVLTGCKSTYNNDLAGDSKVAMVPTVFQLKTSFDDSKKIEGEASMHVLFGFFKWGVSSFSDRANIGGKEEWSLFTNPVQLVKSAAVYNACQVKVGDKTPDMLIGSKYEIVETDYIVYKLLNCKVSGYPGFEEGIEKKADYAKPGADVIEL